MRITDRKPHEQYRLGRQPLFETHEVLFGHVLSDDFEDPHIHVYEHSRVSQSEMTDHLDSSKDGEVTRSEDADLSSEEVEIRKILELQEAGQLLIVIGDVGTGKTTFLQHLKDVHFPTEEFGSIHSIYLDWNNFTASLEDPLPDIYTKFANEIYSALESYMPSEGWLDIDKAIFDRSEIFSRDRAALEHVDESAKTVTVSSAIRDKIEKHPVDFAVERINFLCRDNPNQFVIIVDNVDHLRPKVLDNLQDFIREIRMKTIPLVIMAVRDHTLERTISAYSRQRVRPVWKTRLYSPELKSVVTRRLDYFFPKDVSKGSGKLQENYKGFRLQISDESLLEGCRGLLEAPFNDPNTHSFLRRWSNYNLRDAFSTIQRTIAFSGLSGIEEGLLTGSSARAICQDQCLTAIALGDHKLAYPERSIVFNVYSASAEGGMTDMLSGVRIIDYLSAHRELLCIEELKSSLEHFGYPRPIIERQIKWMANKDVVWTDAGDPNDIDTDTKIRLSYRGKLYDNFLMSRTTYNYLMSFSVYSPSRDHPIGRTPRPEFDIEVDNFSNFSEPIQSDDIAQRVLGLAQLAFSAQEEEAQYFSARKLQDQFLAEIAPRNAALLILDSLSRYMNKILTDSGSVSRPVVIPSHSMLREIAEFKELVEARDFFTV